MKSGLFFFLLFAIVFQGAFADEKTYDIKPQVSELKLKNPDDEISSKELFMIALSLDSLNYKTPSFFGGTPPFEQDFVSVEVGKRMDNSSFNKKGFWEYALAFKKFARDYSTYSQALYLYQFSLFQNFYLPAIKSEVFRLSAGLGISPVYLSSEKSVLSNSLSSFGLLASGKVSLHYQASLRYQFILSYQAGIGESDSKNMVLSSLNFGVCFE